MAKDKLKNPNAIETGTITANVGSIAAQTLVKCGNICVFYASVTGSFTPNQTIVTLPSNFRPRTIQRASATFNYAGNNAMTVFTVGTDGKVTTSYGSSTINGCIIIGTIIL